MYINLTTAEIVPESQIMKATDDGLILYDGNYWRFLPASQVKYVEDSSGSSNYDGTVLSYHVNMNELIESSSVYAIARHYYTYYFGLNDFTVASKKFYPVSAIATKLVPVKPELPVTIEAEIFQPDKTAVEFSVIDGLRETPILPNKDLTVKNEAVFFDQNLRFTATNPVFYKNWTRLPEITSVSDLQIQQSDSEIYTVDYTAPENSLQYSPVNEYIRFKIVFRCFDSETPAPQVSNIKIFQEAS